MKKYGLTNIEAISNIILNIHEEDGMLQYQQLLYCLIFQGTLNNLKRTADSCNQDYIH